MFAAFNTTPSPIISPYAKHLHLEIILKSHCQLYYRKSFIKTVSLTASPRLPRICWPLMHASDVHVSSLLGLTRNNDNNHSY